MRVMVAHGARVMRMHGARVMLTVGALLLLAACGRVGDIRPPGPPDQITWPRSYPSR